MSPVPRAVPTVVLTVMLAVTFGGGPLVVGAARADEHIAPAGEAGADAVVELRADDAPLDGVLEYLAGAGGLDVHVADDIRDRLSGRLTGPADELIELLVATHRLSMYRDGSSVWFDRDGQRVVDFVRLDEAAVEPALTALAHPPAAGGVAVPDASGRGLVLSGTRAYVQGSLARIEMATEPALGDGRDATAFAGSAPSESASGEASVDAPPLAAARQSASPPARFGPPLSLDEPATHAALGARIASVSTRARRAVGLADGTWRVPGDALPNGHRIVAIESDGLLLERDGVGTRVALP